MSWLHGAGPRHLTTRSRLGSMGARWSLDSTATPWPAPLPKAWREAE